MVCRECACEDAEKVPNILFINGAQSAESESIGSGDLTRIDRKAAFIAEVVDLFKIPVRIVGIQDGNHKSCLPFPPDHILKVYFTTASLSWSPAILIDADRSEERRVGKECAA